MKKTIFRLSYFLLVLVILLVILEFAARALGAGDPILYYNAAMGGMRPIPEQTSSRVESKFVTIDKNGFRSRSTNSSADKILYLGDSVTWGGTRIDDKDTFAELLATGLETKLGKKFYSMNAAVNGHSIINQRDIYFSNDIEPDLVVWLFPSGDFERSYATTGFIWPARSKPKFALVEVIDGLIIKLWPSRFRKLTKQKESFTRPDTPEGYEQFYSEVMKDRVEANKEALLEVLEDLSQKGIPIILALSPNKSGDEWGRDQDLLNWLIQEATATGVNTLDILTELDRPELDQYFVDNVHYNEEGHVLVAEVLSAKALSILEETQLGRSERAVPE